jgi:serine/threonine protein kinase/tetratricopeptide (TPR) repeat protein
MTHAVENQTSPGRQPRFAEVVALLDDLSQTLRDQSVVTRISRDLVSAVKTDSAVRSLLELTIGKQDLYAELVTTELQLSTSFSIASFTDQSASLQQKIDQLVAQLTNKETLQKIATELSTEDSSETLRDISEILDFAKQSATQETTDFDWPTGSFQVSFGADGEFTILDMGVQQVNASSHARKEQLADTGLKRRDYSLLPIFEDHFITVKEIGRGGMGVVFEVEPRGKTGRNRIAKVCLYPQHEKRFEQEMDIGFRLNAEGIATVLDAYRTRDGRLVSTIKTVDGEGLDQLFIAYHALLNDPKGVSADQRQLIEDYLSVKSPAAEFRAIEQELVLKGLVEKLIGVGISVDILHNLGVIHRDLKPENVKVDKHSGLPVLLDYGLAREQKESDQLLALSSAEKPSKRDVAHKLTRYGQIMGTFGYMAPEQVSGDSATHGPATDTYALGAMLYHLMTGKLPVSLTDLVTGKARSVLDIMRQIAEHQIEPAQRPGRSYFSYPDLEAICAKAMAKDPLSRYPSVRDFIDDLRRWKDGRAVLAFQEQGAPLSYGIYHWAKSNTIAAGSGATTVVLGLASLAGFFGYSKVESTRADSLAAAAASTLNEAEENLRLRLEELVAGRSVARIPTQDFIAITKSDELKTTLEGANKSVNAILVSSTSKLPAYAGYQSVAGVLNRVQNKQKEIEKEIVMLEHRIRDRQSIVELQGKFLDNAAPIENFLKHDFGSYFSKTTGQDLIENTLSILLPDFKSDCSASVRSFINELESRELTDQERQYLKHKVANLLETWVLKIPYDFKRGIRAEYVAQVEPGLEYLENARLLRGWGEGELTIEHAIIWKRLAEASQDLVLVEHLSDVIKGTEAKTVEDFVRLGKIAYDQGRDDEAERLYLKAIQVAERQSEWNKEFSGPLYAAKFGLGLVYDWLDRYSDAFGLYRECLGMLKMIENQDKTALDAKVSVLTALGRARYGLYSHGGKNPHDEVALQEHFYEAAEIAKKNNIETAKFYENWGAIQNNLGKYKEAVGLLERVTELEPLYGGAVLMTRSRAYAHLGDTTRTVRDIKRALLFDIEGSSYKPELAEAVNLTELVERALKSNLLDIRPYETYSCSIALATLINTNVFTDQEKEAYLIQVGSLLDLASQACVSQNMKNVRLINLDSDSLAVFRDKFPHMYRAFKDRLEQKLSQ